jgi:hypothetical protein
MNQRRLFCPCESKNHFSQDGSIYINDTNKIFNEKESILDAFISSMFFLMESHRRCRKMPPCQ